MTIHRTYSIKLLIKLILVGQEFSFRVHMGERSGIDQSHGFCQARTRGSKNDRVDQVLVTCKLQSISPQLLKEKSIKKYLKKEEIININEYDLSPIQIIDQGSSLIFCFVITTFFSAERMGIKRCSLLSFSWWHIVNTYSSFCFRSLLARQNLSCYIS